jgi:TRAP-type mannitol/chloroaromatic compound transport system permease small subunit
MSTAVSMPMPRTPPAPVRHLLRAIETLTLVDGWMGIVCLASLILLMLATLTIRALSHVIPGIPGDIPVAWEYCSYLMGACFTFGAALTLRTGGHIKVNLLRDIVSPGWQRVLDTVVSVLGTMSVGFLTISMMKFTWRSFDSAQVSLSSGTPLWMPQALVTLGILLLALQLFARSIQAALGLPTEDTTFKAFGAE